MSRKPRPKTATSKQHTDVNQSKITWFTSKSNEENIKARKTTRQATGQQKEHGISNSDSSSSEGTQPTSAMKRTCKKDVPRRHKKPRSTSPGEVDIDRGEKDHCEPVYSEHQSSGSDTEEYSDNDGEEGCKPQLSQASVKKVIKKPVAVRLRGKLNDLDGQEYRDGYPGKKDNTKLTKNLQFYRNQIPSYPEGDYIDEIHRRWRGDYKRLEAHHGYIQWLFPIRESGMNFHAQELQLHEAKAISADKEASQRVVESYKLMLDFYGMVLKNEQTGEVSRADHWKPRYYHLNRSYHNYLRITRILKSLGELGYERLKAPFVEFVIREAFEKKTLTNVGQSCTDYWLQTIRKDKDREHLLLLAETLQNTKR